MPHPTNVQAYGTSAWCPCDAGEEVLQMDEVLGRRVVLLEDLGAEQEEVEEHRVGHELGDLPDRLVLDRDLGRPLQDLEEDRP